jgi:hypothetical protein
MYKMSSKLSRSRGTGSNSLTNRPTCGGDKKAGLVSHIGCSQWTHGYYSRANNTNYLVSKSRMALCEDWKTMGWITMNPTQSNNTQPNAAKHQSARGGLPSV